MNSLYLDHFGLISPPFSITPDPGFFFEGKDRGLFMSGLLHATLHAEGIVIVIGEVGSGKTLMSRMLLARLPDSVNTVYLPNPAFSRDEIIDVIARDLGLSDAAPPKGGRLEMLQQELIRLHTQGKRVVVLIDEAHTMPPDSLEEVRRLSNLETDNHKLVQIILFGQPELNTLLEAPQLRQVNDRVVYRLTLRNLSRDDARAYLEHRLRVAGWRGGRMFTRFAERGLLADANGRARRINLIADKSLLAAFADQSHIVRAKHVRLAVRDIGKNFASSENAPRLNFGTIALWLASIVATAAISFWLAGARPAPEVALSALAANKAFAAADKPVAAPASAPTPNAQVAETQPMVASAASAAPQLADALPASAPTAAASAPATAQSSADLNVAAAAANSARSSDSPVTDNLAERLSRDHNYARHQAAAGGYAIQLATIPSAEDAELFLSAAERALDRNRVFARRSPLGSQSDYRQSRYVIYLGGYSTIADANRAIARLPDNYRQAQPIIRTWKEIIDAPWIL